MLSTRPGELLWLLELGTALCPLQSSQIGIGNLHGTAYLTLAGWVSAQQQQQYSGIVPVSISRYLGQWPNVAMTPYMCIVGRILIWTCTGTDHANSHVTPLILPLPTSANLEKTVSVTSTPRPPQLGHRSTTWAVVVLPSTVSVSIYTRLDHLEPAADRHLRAQLGPPTREVCGPEECARMS